MCVAKALQDIDLLATQKLADYDPFAMAAWPLEKIEPDCEKVVDDETSFPKMNVWIVIVHSPKDIKIMHDHLKARGCFGDELSHVKTIRKTTGDLGDTVYQMIVGTGLDPPVDLPKHYPSPIQCQIPATAATHRTHLEAKNIIWPTVYSPHLLPKPLEHTAADIELTHSAMTLIVRQAQSAFAAGDLPIAACVLQDQFLRSAVVVSDTRNSSKHPLHHAVLNLIREVASSTTSHPHPQVQETDIAPVSAISSRFYRAKPTIASENPSFHSTPNLTHQAVAPIQDPLQNGEGYQLTDRTLYITHEPCVMCTMALVHARVKEVVFIHSMPTTGGCGGTVLVPELKTINHRFDVWRWKDRQAIWPDTLTHDSDKRPNERSAFAEADFTLADASSPQRPCSMANSLMLRAAKMLPVSTFVHMLDEDDFGKPLPNLSPLFQSRTADLILSSCDSYHFKVHRQILVEASTIFHAALVTLPEKTTNEPPPIQELAEDGEIISLLLQYIYPMANPSITSLAILRPTLQAAQKYEISSAIEGLKSTLVSQELLEGEPLGVYSIACEMGLLDEARVASRATLALSILDVPLETPSLQRITGYDFLRLVRLHKNRAASAVAILHSMSPMPHSCCSPLANQADYLPGDLELESQVPITSKRGRSYRHGQIDDAQGTYVRWWATWKEAAIKELEARPTTVVIFESSYIMAHVKRASRHCVDCPPSFMSSATQGWIKMLKERIDALPDTI